ncbi:MAG: tetratricopeptide repeat protein [Cyanobacteria bacterium REEB444]|nr:tetratricopeptide repeat protein [Cyanobacteria bacterium REEB444]
MPTTTEALLVLHWGDKVGAIADYTETVRLDPKYISAYINRGNTRFQMGDKTGAINHYDKAIRLDPKSVYAYNNRGLVRSKMGDKTGARTDLQQAASLLNLLKVNKKDR